MYPFRMDNELIVRAKPDATVSAELPHINYMLVAYVIIELFHMIVPFSTRVTPF